MESRSYNVQMQAVSRMKHLGDKDEKVIFLDLLPFYHFARIFIVQGIDRGSTTRPFWVLFGPLVDQLFSTPLSGDGQLLFRVRFRGPKCTDLVELTSRLLVLRLPVLAGE